MIKIEVNPTDIGQAFADTGANEQSMMLNEMGRFLKLLCKDDHHFDVQLCYIADKLDKQGKNLINGLSEVLDLKEQMNK